MIPVQLEGVKMLPAAFYREVLASFGNQIGRQIFHI